MEQMVSQEHFKINVAARMGIEPGAMAIQGGWYTRCSTRGAVHAVQYTRCSLCVQSFEGYIDGLCQKN